VPYLSASAVVIHHEEALYQVYGPLSIVYRVFLCTPRLGWIPFSWVMQQN